MYLHANAKLGLAGRLALVRAVEDGLSLKAAAAAFSVSPATAHRWWHRWLDGGRQAGARCWIARAGPALAAAARGGAAGADLRLPPPDRLGAAPGRRRDRLRALDGLEGAAPARSLAAPDGGQGAGQQLRVALPRRSAAHGHQPLRALPAARPPRHRRPLAALAPVDASRDEGRLRLRARDRRRPLPARLRRAPRRRESRDRHRLRRAGARLLRRARDRSPSG